MKLDIKKYYPSIDKEILKSKFKKYLKINVYYNYYIKYIKPYVDIEVCKKIISLYDKNSV